MAFSLFRGKAVTMWFPKAASTAFNVGDLVYANGTGEMIPADSTSGNHFGVMQRAVVSSDSDYATTAKVPLLVPFFDAEFTVDVGTGTLSENDIGNFYDLTDAGSINVSATSKKVVLVTGFMSATKAIVQINSMAVNKAVETT